MLTLGVIYYYTIIIYYIILYYYILYIIILLYHILSYTILFSSSIFHSLPSLLFYPFLSSPPPFSPILSCSSFLKYSFYTCRHLHTVIYILFSSSDLSSFIFYLLLFSSPLPSILPLLFSPSSHSHRISINLQSSLIPRILVGTSIHLFIFNQYLIDNLTPHVLSEWMVEV